MTMQAASDGANSGEAGTGNAAGNNAGAGTGGEGGNSQAAAGAGPGAGSGGETVTNPVTGEPIRNWEEVKRIIDENKTLRTKAKEADTALSTLTTAAEDEKLKAAQAAGNVTEVVSILTDRLTTAQAKIAELQTQIGDFSSRDRRGTIADAILQNAKQEHADALRLMVAGLIEAKEINLDAEDIAAEGRKARSKLGKRYPHMYEATEGTQGAGKQGAGERALPTDPWNALSAEEQERLAKNPEAFKKYMEQVAGRVSGASTLFGA